VKHIYFLSRQFKEATMEAASSGSDDSSSEGSESRRKIGRKVGDGRRKRSLEDDEGASSEDERKNNEHDDLDDSSSEEDSDAGSGRNPKEESDSESEDDDDDEEDESAPLAERIRRQREQGVSMNAPRQRKSRARKIASERLAQFRKEKKATEDDDSLEEGVDAGVSDEKKRSKHAPTESSSKRADFYKRKPMLNESGIGVDIGAHKYKPRDPRVDSLSGHLDVQHFEHNFDFLQDMRQKEMGTLRKNIAARKASGRKGQTRRRRMGLTNDGGSLEEDQLELKRLTQEKADVERARIDRAAKQTVKKKLHEDVAEGKRGAFFLKRKEMKRLHLEAKYEEIRKRGGDRAVDKVVAKRRKKNKSKDAGLLGKGIPKNYGNGAAGTNQI
jgi:ribosomal RNA-processing protein 36